MYNISQTITFKSKVNFVTFNCFIENRTYLFIYGNIVKLIIGRQFICRWFEDVVDEQFAELSKKNY